MSEHTEHTSKGNLLIYHPDGQSVTELTDTEAITIDGEGIVTKECICSSYYGGEYGELCKGCNQTESNDCKQCSNCKRESNSNGNN